MLDWGPGLALAREEMRGQMMGGLMVMMLPPLEMSQRVSVVLVRKLERGPRGRKKTLYRGPLASPLFNVGKILHGGLQVKLVQVGAEVFYLDRVELGSLALLDEPPEQSCED